MTKTALEMRKIDKDKEIAAADRKSREQIESEKRKLAREENRKDRVKDYVTGLLGSAASAGGRIASAAIKNDPEWYKRWMDISDLVRIPTFDRLGANLYSGKFMSLNNLVYSVPGVMAIRYIGTTGPQMGSVSAFPINQIGERLKEKVLQLNSRSNVDWEGSDLILNILCSTDIASDIVELGRIIRTYRTYHEANAYLAKCLIRAAGWNYDDVQANYAEYRKTFSMLVEKFNKAVVLPSELSYVARRVFLASQVFADTDESGNPRQTYLYRQQGWLQLSDDGSYALMKDATRESSHHGSISAFRVFVNESIDLIANNPDYIAMYQDLRHAFKNLVQIPTTYADGELTFNTNKQALLQMKNIHTLPAVYNRLPSNVHGFDVYQDNNGFLINGTHGSTTPVYRNCAMPNLDALPEYMANTYKDLIGYTYTYEGKQLYETDESTASGDTIIECTRGSYGGAVRANGFEITTCGTELFLGVTIGVIRQSTTDLIVKDYVEYDAASYSYVVMTGKDSIVTYPISDLLVVKALWDAFKYAPSMTIIGRDIPAGIRSIFCFSSGETKFTISNKDLNTMHECAILSEFFIGDSAFKFNK